MKLRMPANTHTRRIAVCRDRSDYTFQNAQDTGMTMRVRWRACVVGNTLVLTLEHLGERGRDRQRELERGDVVTRRHTASVPELRVGCLPDGSRS